MATLLNTWTNYRNVGLLPLPGTIGDQVAWVAECIELLSLESDTISTEELRRPAQSSNPFESGAVQLRPPTNLAPPVLTMIGAPKKPRTAKPPPT